MTIQYVDTDCPVCDDQPAMMDDQPTLIPSSAGYVVVENEDQAGIYHTIRRCYNCNHRNRPQTRFR